MYNQVVLTRFQNLQNAGIVTNADAVGQVGSISAGEMIKVYLRIVKGVITEAKFKTFGGVFTLVASDVVCDLLKNQTVETALLITSDNIVKALNGLPEDKLQIADLAQSVIVDAIDDYHKKLAKAKLNQKK
ncbi:MAG: iron-sulfur cluster assembly scaffold protein [Prevotella sp.]|nr:iron-sulfur cluster assembly scaffold protein [Prevotella sp.]